MGLDRKIIFKTFIFVGQTFGLYLTHKLKFNSINHIFMIALKDTRILGQWHVFIDCWSGEKDVDSFLKTLKSKVEKSRFNKSEETLDEFLEDLEIRAKKVNVTSTFNGDETRGIDTMTFSINDFDLVTLYITHI